MYTKDQMREAWDAGAFALGTELVSNVCGHDRPGPKEFDDFLATLTPEPSADVVERIKSEFSGLAWNFYLDDNTASVVLVEDLTEIVAIIEAEVERRVRCHENRQ